MDINKNTVVEYIYKKLPKFFDGDKRLTVSEIGDGNINYVYRLEQISTGKSLIIKHADANIRTSGRNIGTQRSVIEAEALLMQNRLAPAYVPKIYLYDEENSNIIMQDMRAYTNLRYGLIEHRVYPLLAKHLADFCAKTLIGTCDVLMPIAEKRELARRFTNIQLCEISERLVFTEPYIPVNDNSFVPQTRQFVEQEIYGDVRLKLAVAKLKNLFQSKAQSLLHGDLHSGSVFCTDTSTCVLDPEFAFYGPAGYDVGNLIGNVVFAIANARQTIANPAERAAYCRYLAELIRDFADGFKTNAMAMLAQSTGDPMMTGVGFAEYYVNDVMKDAVGYAGTEIIRRIIGSAKVKDITCIEAAEKRSRAEVECLTAAKQFILTPEAFLNGTAYSEYFAAEF